MASEKITALIEEVKNLSVLELSELVKALEEEFGVSAAAMAAPAAGAGAAATTEEEKTEFDVVLEGFDAAAKIKVIKIVQLVIVFFRKTILRRRSRDYSIGQIKGDLSPLPLRQSIQGQIANTLHAENHRSGQQQCQQHLQTQMLLTHVSAPFPPTADITKRTRPTPPARSSPASHS